MGPENDMRQLVNRFANLLTVEQTGEDDFVGARTPEDGKTGTGRVFGGLVIAQALAAAQATVPEERAAHSLHAYFLRAGDDTKPIHFHVDRDLDGGSFSNRRVVASQDGRPILTLSGSFHRFEDGLHHQDEMPDVPGPDELTDDVDMRRRNIDQLPAERREAFLAQRPILQRSVEALHWTDATPAPARNHTWFKAGAPLGDDPRLHRAVLAYISDFTLLRTSALPHGINWFGGILREASLDHALWFHEDFRADQWLLYATESPWAGHARGYCRGRIFTQDGRHVASVTQEGLIRVVGKR